MKLENIKMVFIDLDGTSLDKKRRGQRYLSHENIEAIEECRQNGIEVIVSTGRGINSRTDKILSQLNDHKNLVAWNGAKIKLDNKIIKSTAIEKEVATDILEKSEKNKLVMVLNSDFRHLTITKSLITRMIIKLKGGKHLKPENLDLNKEIFKVILWSKNTKKLHEVIDYLRNKYNDKINIITGDSHATYFEITAIDASKGLANKLFAEMKNIDLDKCVHIGDSMNDASTAKYFKNVIAMKNADNDFKKVASIVSEFEYKNGGLAKTIKKYIL